MQFWFSYRCGHTGSVNLEGPNTNGRHEPRLDVYRSRLCPRCVERQRPYEPADLVGSSKQVSWANGIRDRKLREASEAAGRFHASLPSDEALGYLLEADSAYRKLLKQKYAGWWIDRRGDDAMSLLESFMEGKWWRR